MWPILFRDAGSVAKKSYALIESRLFSASNAYLKGGSSRNMVENERRKRLRRTNQEWHQRMNAYKRNYMRRVHEMNPDFAEKELERHRELYATNPQHKLSCLISAWVRNDRWAWVCELPWKTHRPVIHTTPVQHRCESCGLTRLRGLRFVWQSITQPHSYSCHACYMKQESEVCMPKGYEDVRGMRALVARKRQLDELNSKASRAEDTIDGGKK
ncbi:hypothetical protein M436DRAFT_61271 [Aureobasidium namibiae CBS 147.97]|uniref:Uncharacterized protein n=1 Tax=Aureobasidium namibiae CBS 147.97 TaxID=1043004 RepID=A0A074WS50_9PEZI|nr:uncharacterized protein M436DRAFT_61271 [Aureobasidium namibiae CBS 147.97]KEQ75978.1 hypothetical protein M436DRAFT_61271 [Aureobasidium namibiae CBS 147.97]